MSVVKNEDTHTDREVLHVIIAFEITFNEST